MSASVFLSLNLQLSPLHLWFLSNKRSCTQTSL